MPAGPHALVVRRKSECFRARGGRSILVLLTAAFPSSRLPHTPIMSRSRPLSRVVRLLAVACIAVGLTMILGCHFPLAHPRMKPFQRYAQPRDSTEYPPDSAGLTVRFMGTSSLLFTDRDSTSILMDGFVSRPHWARVGLWTIGPNCRRIRSAYARLDTPVVAAVFAGHAHYDHAMDAPVWAQMTGAELVGSQSIKMLGLGIGLPDSQITVVPEDTKVPFGNFELTFVESAHGPPDRYPGTRHAPLEPRKRARKWATGLVYSVFIRHRGRTILVQSTAGYKPGALLGRHADVVYLAVGGLGHQPLAAIDTYWNEVVRATGARRVILVHWDDFFRSLDKPMLATPYGGDNVARGVGRIVERAISDGVDVRIPDAFTPADPFHGLSLPMAPVDPARKPVTLHPRPDTTYCPADPAAEAIRSQVRGGR
jgi:L-ascorbate metabolism protein UlaG (beta-lactamase superfamily)